MKIQYIAPLGDGMTSLQRLEALQRLGHEVAALDVGNWFPSRRSGLFSLERKLRFGPRVLALNHAIISRARQHLPEIVWVDKGLLIWHSTLRALKQMPQRPLVVHFSPDDQLNPRNQSRHYLRGVADYDAHVTTKLHNITELERLGARRVIFTSKGFCPFLHRKMNLTAEDRRRFGADVSFVGSFEQARLRSLTYLAQHGISIRVWGPGWREYSSRQHPLLMIEGKEVWGQDYAKIINASSINLCYLRKENRDTSTARSVEIPACSSFMLAEKTEEHLSLFSEGREAAYFSDDYELVQKIRYYLAHPRERSLIAQAGFERAHRSGYANDCRLEMVIRRLTEAVCDYSYEPLPVVNLH